LLIKVRAIETLDGLLAATGTTSDQYPPLVSPDDGGGEGMAASASSEA
jgi:hypothetical protein